jgi:hypothetical protein
MGRHATEDVVGFLAVVLTALALVPAGAHLLELPNKIGLPRDAYFTVQGIYRGWALTGIVLFAALAADLLLAFLLRRQRWPFRLALAGFLLLAAALAVFFAWTWPANQATQNWTAIPDDWASLRTQWETAHAAGAVLTLAALCAVTAAVVRREPPPVSPAGGTSGPRGRGRSRGPDPHG